MQYPTEWVEITSDMAAEWLSAADKQGFQNRTLSKSTVARYARDMEAGNWHANGEPICVDEDGVPINGQHRLQACVESGASFWSVVVRGLPRDMAATYDQNRVRQTRDVLVMRGIPNQSAVASAASVVWGWLNGCLGTAARPTRDEQLTVIEECMDDLQEAVQHTAQLKLLPSSVRAGLMAVFLQVDAQMAREMFERLETGIGLTADDPVYLLRERLIKEAARKARLPQRELLALVIKTWNYRRKGKRVRSLRYASRGERPEPFPEVV